MGEKEQSGTGIFPLFCLVTLYFFAIVTLRGLPILKILTRGLLVFELGFFI
jgi:hypothetical protein